MAHVPYDPYALRAFIASFLKLAAQRIRNDEHAARAQLEEFSEWIRNQGLVHGAIVYSEYDDCEDPEDWAMCLEVTPYPHPYDLRWIYQLIWDDWDGTIRLNKQSNSTDPGACELYWVRVRQRKQPDTSILFRRFSLEPEKGPFDSGEGIVLHIVK